ncbi:hypothetical protein Trydic_g11403 [Trypoxylus dichotomus]
MFRWYKQKMSYLETEPNITKDEEDFFYSNTRETLDLEHNIYLIWEPPSLDSIHNSTKKIIMDEPEYLESSNYTNETCCSHLGWIL